MLVLGGRVRSYTPVWSSVRAEILPILFIAFFALSSGLVIDAYAQTNTFGSSGTGNGQLDTPREITTNSTHILIADSGNDRVQIFDLDGTYAGQFGGPGTGNGEFNNPYGITTNSTHILVTDRTDNRVQIFDHSGNYVSNFGGPGTGNGQFDRLAGITTNSTHIFVTDSENERVQIFDHSGNYVSQFGSQGSGDGQFDEPIDIVLTSTRILVVDRQDDRVQIFDHSGNYVSQFGSQGIGNGQFRSPQGIASTSTHILIVDSSNNRLQAFDHSGNYVSQLAISGSPDSIAVNGDNVYVTDSFFHRVNVYSLSPLLDVTGPTFVSADATSMTQINVTASEPLFGTVTAADFRVTVDGTVSTDTTPPTLSGNIITLTVNTPISRGSVFIVSYEGDTITDMRGNTMEHFSRSVTNTFLIFGASGTGDGEFMQPRGITANSTHILVADTENDRVQVFDHDGVYAGQFGEDGTGDGQFNAPRGIVTNSTHILITDFNNQRVQVFDHSGNYLSQFGSDGTGNGQFQGPSGIATNSTHILVTETTSDRVQVFDHSGNYLSQFGSDGTGNGQFDQPSGIATNSTHILLTDRNNNRVQIFDHSGNYVSQFASGGPDDGEFALPQGIVTTSTHILVADTANDRVQIFDHSGNYVSQYGSMGTAYGQFDDPHGITTSGQNVLVTEANNNRVQIFDASQFDLSGLSLSEAGNTGSTGSTGGSGGNIAQSKPHFGLSPLTQVQLVSCGFSMDGECRDVVDYHVPYDRTVIQTGTTHDFTLKPFNNYNLKMLQLGLGVKEVGDSINTAEALIVVELELDYKSDIGYAVESVITENNLEDVIDEVTESNVSLSTEPCMTGLKKDCLVVHINDVMFRDVFYSEPFVINVVDTKRLSSTNYLNEGIIVTGESLNPAPEYHLTTGKKVQQVVERLNLVRTDKVNDIWTDNNGNQWTQNSHDTWIQVTFTPYVEPQDPTMSVMTRINNNFDGIILQERERAILVWDSSKIQGEIKPSFSYTFDEKLDKLDDPIILQKLDMESEKALEILRAAGYYSADE